MLYKITISLAYCAAFKKISNNVAEISYNILYIRDLAEYCYIDVKSGTSETSSREFAILMLKRDLLDIPGYHKMLSTRHYAISFKILCGIQNIGTMSQRYHYKGSSYANRDLAEYCHIDAKRGLDI
ncbi:hypothetical protein AVEN_88405-1 [Araneus ventricosus]|uniref:Uncharacterized protein n=1 Tax=Araneus ventricosus TaxID=182803 RepID=A0A4Y2PNT8_ARAVE|nr:hypothetical protein AVEN_88405-1 [Araneus ventricosus]